jgi:hypothetical protein
MAMPISRELQARIDALTDENLKANILRYLNRPWKRAKSNEKIFEEMVADYKEVMAQRAKWRQWTDEEVAAFVEHYKHEMPDDFVEFLRQEREEAQIDADLAWRARHLARSWIAGLDYVDYGSLLGKTRDYVRAHLI